MARAFFLAGDNFTGCTWYRCVLPAIGLTWLGHDARISTEVVDDIESYDTVVGARIAHPAHVAVWRRLRDAGVRTVLDLDDDYFHLTPRHHSPAVLDQWAALMPGLREAVKLSDVVTCASAGIAEVVADEGGTQVVVGNALPAQFLGEARDYTAAGRDTIVGWSGSGATVGALGPVKRALRMASELAGTGVLFVGLPPDAPELHGLEGRANIRTTGYIRRQEDYLRTCAQFDLWVAPYEDTPFNQAKFPTKSLEAGFLGIPLVASAIRPYVETVEHGVTGYLVRSDHEWSRFISRLARDPDLRQRMGLAARARASASILQAMNARWAEVLFA